MSYNRISFQPECQTKSEYFPLIDPEPLPCIIEGRSCQPNIFDPYRMDPSVPNNFATSLNIVFQFSSIRYASFKRLDPCNERMVYIYCYGMGREFIFKAQIDPTKTHNYKTKCIMEQLDVQNSFDIIYE